MKDMKDMKALAKAGACQICRRGCHAPYNCGHEEKKDFGLDLYGENTVCPLAKYGCKPGGAKLDSFGYAKLPTKNQMFAICHECEHSKNTDTATEYSYDNEECFGTHCIDCPVYAIQEELLVGAAEAMIS